MSQKITLRTIQQLKGKQKITSLTAYEIATAQLFDEAGVDILLVGDSLGMVLYGDPNTLSVTMEDMIRHTQGVARGVKRALVVTDMPYGSYDTTQNAVWNAKRLLSVGAKAVKVEGAGDVISIIEGLRSEDIEVMGHLGLTPQTITDFKVQGKRKEDAAQILDDALALEEAGICLLVLECIPTELAEQITHALRIPTIGIGAGPKTDGQILVSYDLLGLYPTKAKFVRQAVDLKPTIKQAVLEYCQNIEQKRFPNEAESFHMNLDDLPQIKITH